MNTNLRVYVSDDMVGVELGGALKNIIAICAGVCDGLGLGDNTKVKDLGVDGIISGGQTMNPATEDILRQINATPAEVVFVLPNNKNIIMAAEQCVGLAEGKEVVVVPSKTVPQGIATLLVMDPDADTQIVVRNL